MSAIEDQIKKTQDGSEATRDESYAPDTTGERPGRTQSVVQPVRLPADKLAEIEELARAAVVPVSALIRGWVLAGLAEDRDATLADAVERLAASVDRVRRLAMGSCLRSVVQVHVGPQFTDLGEPKRLSQTTAHRSGSPRNGPWIARPAEVSDALAEGVTGLRVSCLEASLEPLHPLLG